MPKHAPNSRPEPSAQYEVFHHVGVKAPTRYLTDDAPVFKGAFVHIIVSGKDVWLSGNLTIRPVGGA